MTNYQKHLAEIRDLKGKPTLLIHICCGVCSVFPLEYLRKYFKITIFFSNSNIYPYEEYQKRLEALEQYLEILNDDSIKLIIDTYDNETYMQKLSKFKDEPEGGRRCKICYRLRMEESFRYAKKHDYDWCTSVMSISNRKNADWINEIGEELENIYQIRYLHCDFKKADGLIKNDAMNKKLNLYHQSYCGCRYSIRKNTPIQ